jgi:exonuclease SbcC
MSHILRRVELWNFKSHEHSNIRLSPGINAITGRNYAGKTSILQGVGLCLFNSCEGNRGDYVRKGARHAVIHVEFTSLADERLYRAERRLGSGAYWRVWDVELDVEAAQQEEDVKRFIARHLHLRAGTDAGLLFENAVGVPQGEITSAFMVPPSGRKPIFDGLLRIEEYEKAWQGLKPVCSDVQNRITDLGRQIARLEGETSGVAAVEALRNDLVGRVDAAERTVAAFEKSVRDLSGREADHARARGEVESRARQSEAAQAALALARQKRQAAHDALTEAETALKSLTALEPAYSAYSAAELEREALRERHQERGVVKDRWGAANGELTLRVAAFESAREKVAAAVAAVAEAERLRPLSARQGELEAAAADAKAAADRLSGELNAARRAQSAAKSGKCPLLGEICENTRQRGKALDVFCDDREAAVAAECQEADAAWRGTQAALDGLRVGGRLPGAMLSIAEMQAATLPEAESLLRQTGAAVEQQQKLLTQVGAELTPFADLDARIEACKALLKSHKEDHDRYLGAQGIAGKVEERRRAVDSCAAAYDVADASSQAHEAALAAAKAAYDASAHAALVAELEGVKRTCTAAQTNLSRDRKEMAETEVRLTDLRACLEELDRLRGDQERQQEILSVLEDLREAIRGAGPKVAELVVAKVSAEADRLFGSMIGDSSVALRWTSDYEVRLAQFGVERGLKGAAGSERVLAALAVRLALVESLGEVRFAFLDEPTIHLDEARRAALADRLSAFTQFDQLVVISHDDSFEAKVGSVIHVEKIEERSVVS